MGMGRKGGVGEGGGGGGIAIIILYENSTGGCDDGLVTRY